MKSIDPRRRRLCQAGLALGAAAMLPGCGGNSDSTSSCGDETIAVGNVADVPVNGALLQMTPGADVFICRDDGGLYAVDAGCTHLGCDVMLKVSTDLSQGFACPCHGATYDASGQNPTAPAPSPLPHYALCMQPSGTLLVDVNTTVDPKARLKP